MARRCMRRSNKKTQSQRRDVHNMIKVREKELLHAQRSLFSNTTPVPSDYIAPPADSGYVRETISYPSNNAIGGSTEAPIRQYANSSVIIGQAYNKGNLVVLTNDESNDPNTGKRR